MKERSVKRGLICWKLVYYILFSTQVRVRFTFYVLRSVIIPFLGDRIATSKDTSTRPPLPT